MFTSEQRGAPTGLAVLTGGGDAGGMNGAVLAVVRPALYRGMQPYAVHEDRAGWSKAPA